MSDKAPSKGMLYVVATPIGNLQDITFRAVEILKSADIIVCEDTRKSRILLTKYNISAKTISMHKFSESKKTEAIIELLNNGKNVALISDAGTPAISDPGHRLTAAAGRENLTVTPIPGPSSIVAALSVSGFDCSTFCYLGYCPRKATTRVEFFEQIQLERRTTVFFESPNRIKACLKTASAIIPNRRALLSRELTKIHEELMVKSISELNAEFGARETIKGEFIIVIQGASESGINLNMEAIVRELMAEGLTGKNLVEQAKFRYGANRNSAYKIYLKLMNQ